MPRKKQPTAAPAADAHSATAVAEPNAQPATPAWVAGPDVPLPATAEEPKPWGNPYKAIFSGHDFELGENRRFKQRVFTFKDKPAPERLAALKEAGFIYRAGEKAWTIQADAESRKQSDALARQFAGPGQGMTR